MTLSRMTPIRMTFSKITLRRTTVSRMKCNTVILLFGEGTPLYVVRQCVVLLNVVALKLTAEWQMTSTLMGQVL
jgi:hypothetical protein